MRVALIAGALALISVPASAWLGGTSWTWEVHKPTQYKLEAVGADLRVYEWIPKSNPEDYCIALFGSQGFYQMRCGPREPWQEIEQKEPTE